MHYSLARFERSEVAKQRLRIIEFYERYGERATKEAFGVDRRLVSRWRRRLADAGGALSALVPLSTRPHRVRRSDVAQQIIDFIRNLREEHPRLGKEKIKPLLDEYCARAGLKTVSESTIGNIIKRHNLFYQKSGRAYHDPRRARTKAAASEALTEAEGVRVYHLGHGRAGHRRHQAILHFGDRYKVEVRANASV